MHRAPNCQVPLKIYCTALHQNIPPAQSVYSFWGWSLTLSLVISLTVPLQVGRQERGAESRATGFPASGRQTPLGRKQLPVQCWAEENQGPFWLRYLGLTKTEAPECMRPSYPGPYADA